MSEFRPQDQLHQEQHVVAAEREVRVAAGVFMAGGLQLIEGKRAGRLQEHADDRSVGAPDDGRFPAAQRFVAQVESERKRRLAQRGRRPVDRAEDTSQAVFHHSAHLKGEIGGGVGDGLDVAALLGAVGNPQDFEW